MAKYSVTPWEVTGEVDYSQIIKQFGTQHVNDALLKQIEKEAGELHFLLKRKIFFSHRDLDWVLKEFKKGNKFYLYTGRGPSGHTHLGHLMPWVLTKWLQDKFGSELWFQITDDEKFLFREKLSMKDVKKHAYENILDIIALGFSPKKTKIFLDTEYANTMYPRALEVAKKLTVSTTNAVFGLKNSSNVGKVFFTSMQSVPAFLPSDLAGKNIPCLIPMAIDQDPHFRIARDILPKLGFYKPAALHCMFLPALQGPKGKMSASQESGTIYTTDSAKQVENKIKKYAFSGGQATTALHRKKGGNTDVDVSYQYLRMFFESEDKKLKKVKEDYESGKMLTGELKELLIGKVNAFLEKHQQQREKAKDKIEDFIVRD